MPSDNFAMDLSDFIARREARWQRLAKLLDRESDANPAKLTGAEIEELFAIYRLTSSDLSLLQTRGGSPALTDYLEALVARAYQQVTVPRGGGFFRGWWRIIRHDFPLTVRRQWPLVLTATLILTAGILASYAITLEHPSAALSFVPHEFFRQSPAANVAHRIKEQSSRHFEFSAAKNFAFSAFLFTHNILAGILSFALGMTFGIGTVVFQFFNGCDVGSLAARYQADHVFTYFIAWVGPHGALELPALTFSSTAGLLLARAQWTRGGRHGSVLRAIQAQRLDIVNLLVGSATLFIGAGCIEGGFSQLAAPIIPYNLKIAVAATIFSVLLIYLFLMPARVITPESPRLAFSRTVQNKNQPGQGAIPDTIRSAKKWWRRPWRNRATASHDKTQLPA